MSLLLISLLPNKLFIPLYAFTVGRIPAIVPTIGLRLRFAFYNNIKTVNKRPLLYRCNLRIDIYFLQVL